MHEYEAARSNEYYATRYGGRLLLDEWRAWREAGDAMFEGDPDDEDDED